MDDKMDERPSGDSSVLSSSSSSSSPLSPALVRSWFDSLPDDMVYVIGTYLDVPGILSFALISKQFNSCVVQGYCFEDLALKLFPSLDELYSILPGEKKSYRDKLKHQFVASRKAKRQAGGGASFAAAELQSWKSAEETKIKKSLQEDYSFFIRFDLKAGGYDTTTLPLKRKEKEDMVKAFGSLRDRDVVRATNIIMRDPFGGVVDVAMGGLDNLTTATLRELQEYLKLLPPVVSLEKDAIIANAQWAFPSMVPSGVDISVSFDLLEDVVEFPLWPKMEDYGKPGEVGYEQEKERRQAFNLIESYGGNGNFGADEFIELTVFVVKRESGETSPLVVSNTCTDWVHSEFRDGDVVEWFVYHGSSHHENFDFPLCACSRSTCSCRSRIIPRLRTRTRKAEGGGGVPKLVCRVECVDVDFEVCSKGDDRDPISMGLSSVRGAFKLLFEC